LILASSKIIPFLLSGDLSVVYLFLQMGAFMMVLLLVC
jgi:hypothetical protein